LIITLKNISHRFAAINLKLNYLVILFIFKVNDSAFSFLGESQEEDRKLIAELIIEKMTTNIKPQSMNNEMLKSNMYEILSLNYS
jgi:hypothetical protein